MSPEFTQTVQEIVLLTVPVLMAVTFHEVAHGYVANLLGDPTARLAGRLTLNPIKHLDLLGLLAFVVTRMIGWAKPVPVNPRYFKDPRRGMMLVAVAGPGMNLLLAVLCALAVRGLEMAAVDIVPGSLVYRIVAPVYFMCKAGVSINLALAVFNLLPLPPLDGSNILAGFLPPLTAMRYMSMGRWGFFILLLLAVTGVLGFILQPPVTYLYRLLL